MSYTTPGLDSFAAAVDAERTRQHAKWGEQGHPDGTSNDRRAAEAYRRLCQLAAEQGKVTWKLILEEEVQEAFAETDPVRLRAELVQVAAVCAAWIGDIDRRAAPAGASR